VVKYIWHFLAQLALGEGRSLVTADFILASLRYVVTACLRAALDWDVCGRWGSEVS